MTHHRRRRTFNCCWGESGVGRSVRGMVLVVLLAAASITTTMITTVSVTGFAPPRTMATRSQLATTTIHDNLIVKRLTESKSHRSQSMRLYGKQQESIWRRFFPFPPTTPPPTTTTTTTSSNEAEDVLTGGSESSATPRPPQVLPDPKQYEELLKKQQDMPFFMQTINGQEQSSKDTRPGKKTTASLSEIDMDDDDVDDDLDKRFTWNTFSDSALREELERRGLLTDGTKAELVARLQGNDARMLVQDMFEEARLALWTPTASNVLSNLTMPLSQQWDNYVTSSSSASQDIEGTDGNRTASSNRENASTDSAQGAALTAVTLSLLAGNGITVTAAAAFAAAYLTLVPGAFGDAARNVGGLSWWAVNVSASLLWGGTGGGIADEPPPKIAPVEKLIESDRLDVTLDLAQQREQEQLVAPKKLKQLSAVSLTGPPPRKRQRPNKQGDESQGFSLKKIVFGLLSRSPLQPYLPVVLTPEQMAAAQEKARRKRLQYRLSMERRQREVVYKRQQEGKARRLLAYTLQLRYEDIQRRAVAARRRAEAEARRARAEWLLAEEARIQEQKRLAEEERQRQEAALAEEEERLLQARERAMAARMAAEARLREEEARLREEKQRAAAEVMQVDTSNDGASISRGSQPFMQVDTNMDRLAKEIAQRQMEQQQLEQEQLAWRKQQEFAARQREQEAAAAAAIAAAAAEAAELLRQRQEEEEEAATRRRQKQGAEDERRRARKEAAAAAEAERRRQRQEREDARRIRREQEEEAARRAEQELLAERARKAAEELAMLRQQELEAEAAAAAAEAARQKASKASRGRSVNVNPFTASWKVNSYNTVAAPADSEVDDDDLDFDALTQAARQAVEAFEQGSDTLGAASSPSSGDAAFGWTTSSWSEFSLEDLREELEIRGLPVSGSKADWIALLDQSDLEIAAASSVRSDVEAALRTIKASMAASAPEHTGPKLPSSKITKQPSKLQRPKAQSLTWPGLFGKSYDRMSLPQLRNELRQRGLPVTGDREDLILRLQESSE